MKTFAIAALATLALAGTASAADLSNTYVTGSVGAHTQELSAKDIDFNVGSIAAGKKFGAVRVEGEYVRLTDIETNDIDADLFNVNVAYDLKSYYGVTPFVGVGAGYGKVGKTRGDQDGLVLNYTVGASYPLTAKLGVVAQFRAFNAADIDVAQAHGGFDNLNAKVFTVGGRYSF
jgi:opacity protein-like surface antigen